MNLWDHIDPAELTGYVRAALADREENQFSLARWLPSREVADLTFRFMKGGSGLADAAVFRAYDAESPIGSRPTAARVTGELPPISRKIRLGEYDSLRLRNADQAIIDQVFADALRMATSIAARLELARGEALANGSVVLDENDVKATVDFGRTGGHSVSAAITWATDTTDMLTELLGWVDTYTTANGQPPGAILTSTRVKNLMLRSTKIRELAGSISGAPQIVAPAQLDQVFSAFGLPPLTIYDAQVSVNGSATRVIADDRLLLLPAPDANPDTNELGSTMLGMTAESMEPGYNLAGTEPGVVAGSYKSDDPVAVWTKAAALALPVVANPDLTFAADVVV